MSRHSLDDLIDLLDLRQKVRLLTGEDFFTLYAEPTVGLGKLAFSDGPTGVRGLKFTGGARSLLLPNATLLASSWDERLMHRVGELLGEEAERQQIHVVLGPTINLHRSPLGGRLFEAYSEDPLLTGKLAAAYIAGMQSRRIAACPKHLVANESETDRNFMDSRVAPDVLREVYLLPFEIACQQARPWTMMAAYNKVNGEFATEHHQLMQEIVKDEWGFDGLIMSDWLATKTTVAPATAGMDLVMPGPDGPWGDELVAAVESGAVAEATIDDKVRRLFRLAERTGALRDTDVGGDTAERSGNRQWTQGTAAPDSVQRQRELVRLAAAGMTLLRNRDGVLPLSGDTSAALIGRHGIKTVCMGGGSAKVNPPHQVSIAEGLAAAGMSPVICDGVEVRCRPVPAVGGFVVQEGNPGIRVDLFDAERELMQTLHHDSGEFGVGQDDDTPRPVAHVRIVTTVCGRGPTEIGVQGTGRWRVRIGEQEQEVLLRVSGHDPGEAHFKPPFWQTVVDLTGDTEFEAWLEVRPVEGVSDQSSGHAQLDEVIASGLGTKTLIARPAPRPVDQVLADAAVLAEVAVVVVGLTEQDETEAIDKQTLQLPGDQDRLVWTVAAAARRTVVVVNSATPVLMPWAEEVDAILVVGLPGQEGGHAVAATLLGTLEPAGRLVTTWPSADGAAPAWQITPDAGRGLDYADGRFVGHRGYRPHGLAPTPAYWFGEGLGYGEWDYADASVESGAEAPLVRVRITNTGPRSSREVVQAYFAPASADEPIRLVGWSTAEVAPGESAEVTVECEPRMWRRWDTDANRWRTLDPAGEILIARGLGDGRIRLRCPD